MLSSETTLESPSDQRLKCMIWEKFINHINTDIKIYLTDRTSITLITD